MAYYSDFDRKYNDDRVNLATKLLDAETEALLDTLGDFTPAAAEVAIPAATSLERDQFDDLVASAHAANRQEEDAARKAERAAFIADGIRTLSAKGPRRPKPVAGTPLARTDTRVVREAKERQSALQAAIEKQKRNTANAKRKGHDNNKRRKFAATVNTAAPVVDLSFDASLRKSALEKACANKSAMTPLLRQIAGRIPEIIGWYMARESARLEFGPDASLRQIAAAYGDGKASKDSARNRLKILDELETTGGIWTDLIAYLTS